ncbi:MAG: hypothetical protein FVQ77_09140 [Cytophagales bacterium]|nr:hypothetical protein [Cytophagales bacterium]
MAVRLPIEITFCSKTVKVTAIANTGYETNEPEILMPLSLAANQLGIKESQGKEITYQTAGRQDVEFYRFENAGICVNTDNSKSPVVTATLNTSENEVEVILNDMLVGMLGIVLVKVAEGKWRFLDDPPEKLRDSSPKQLFY